MLQRFKSEGKVIRAVRVGFYEPFGVWLTIIEFQLLENMMETIKYKNRRKVIWKNILERDAIWEIGKWIPGDGYLGEKQKSLSTQSFW